MRKGFGLIEFMIVITVFGIATAVITASFLTFERNQRLKSAASMLKNDIRLIQNKALGGDKSTPNCSKVTDPAPVLVGWYLNVVKGSSEYTLNSDCRNKDSIEDPDILIKIVSLPRGVKISDVQYGNSSPVSKDAINVLFQPLTHNTSFHDALLAITPPFLDNSGNLKDLLGSLPQEMLSIILARDQGGTYKVIVQPSGEVNEQK